MSASHQKLEAIFDAALELSAAEREIYLARACSGDLELTRKVELLLRASDRGGQFLTRGNPTSGPSAPGGSGSRSNAGSR